MPEAKPNRNALIATLESARRDLLDLGLRNTLLNYRPLRAKGVEVVDEKPIEIFRLLVREEKRLTFLPGESPGAPDNENGAGDQLTQPGDERGHAARHTDSRLQTTYTSSQLQGRLLATYHAARTSIEEQGVNTLFLALGMLSWREEDHSDRFCRAPLILVPVELERSDARDRFHLQYTGEELGANVSLAEKLKQNFGIKSFPDLPDADDLDVDDYLKKVQRAVRSQVGWTVDTEAIALGFFSFAKFLMYRDLDPTTWPAADAILDHGILQALLGEDGFRPTSSNYSEDRLLDDQIKNRDIVQVVDSDSSQSLAILDSLDGHTMVIHGPPGTGKSQTIVNLIATAIGEGRHVLFVSEKMAALDVVKRRLDRVRLGAACLELHSNRTNKKTITEELRRTALGERQPSPRLNAELSLLRDTRDRLNAYCKAVNEPIGASGENPCTAYGKLLGAQNSLKGLELPQVQMVTVTEWTAEDVVRRTQLVAQLQERVSRSGIPIRHPFWGSQLTVMLPTDRDYIRNLCLRAEAACSCYAMSATSLAQTFSAEAPMTERGVGVLLRSVEHVLRAPELAGVNLSSAEWIGRELEIRQALAAGRRHRDLHRQFGAALRSEAWTMDVSGIRQCIADLGNRWWRFLSRRWWGARKALAAICAIPVSPDQGEQLALLDAIGEASACALEVARASDSISLFGSFWKEIDSDWDLLEAQTNWVMDACKGIREGTLAIWCIDPKTIAVDRRRATAEIRQLETVRQDYQSAVRVWADRLQVEESWFAEGPLSGQHFQTLKARWTAQGSRIEELRTLIAFNQISGECESEDVESPLDRSRQPDRGTPYLDRFQPDLGGV